MDARKRNDLSIFETSKTNTMENTKTTYKENPEHDRVFFCITIISDGLSYFGNQMPEPNELKRMANQLDDDFMSIPGLTKDLIVDAMKHGRKNSDNILKCSPRLILQWVRDYKIRFDKSHERISQSFVTFTKQPVSNDENCCWIVSCFREFKNNNGDMMKFFDFGSLTYLAIYQHAGFSLTEKQRAMCFQNGKQIDFKLGGLDELLSTKQQKTDSIDGNASASAWACKLFFDQFKTESDLRDALMWHKPIHPDHWTNAWYYNPQRRKYNEVVEENRKHQVQQLTMNAK